MKLEELLKKITPTPYSFAKPPPKGADEEYHSIEGDEVEIAAVFKSAIIPGVGGDVTLPKENALYLMHAANTLPELVRTAQNFIDCINNFAPEHKEQIDVARQEFEDALTAAENVKEA